MSARPSGSALEMLLGSAQTERFLEDVWDKQYLVSHGDVARFEPLLSAASRFSVADLFDIYGGPVMVIGALAFRETQGLADRFLTPAATAAGWYDAGATLEFDCLDHYLPVLRSVVDDLSRVLQLPEGTFAKAVGYASPPGSGVGFHFDAYPNFVLQLRGRKRWRLAPNVNATSPVDHYNLYEYPMIPTAIRSYWRGDTRPDCDTLSETVELSPGSVLFVPRGVWHATEAAEATVSINFNFSVPTWLDLAIQAVRSRLVRDERWRELAVGCGSRDPAIAAVARTRLVGLLPALLQEVVGLDADQIVAEHRTPHDTLQIATLTFHELSRPGVAGSVNPTP